MPQLSQEQIERQFQGAPRMRHHEAVYPRSDGEASVGGAIVLTANAADKTNGPATTLNYWGETHVIVPVSTVTEDPWYFIGAYITLLDVASQNKSFQGAWYKVSIYNRSARNAGNNWDHTETVLTVADSTPFAVDDLVWVVSSHNTSGEIQKVADVTGDVVTVVRETNQWSPGAGSTGLRWDHTSGASGGNEVMYLCCRPDNAVWHATGFQYESGSTRRNMRYVWAAPRVMPPNSGLIARILNATDSTDDLGMTLKAVYNHV